MTKWRRLFYLQLPTVFSYLATLGVWFTYRFSSEADQWAVAYSIPGLLAGLLNLKIIHDLERGVYSRRATFQLYVDVSLLYFASVALLSLFSSGSAKNLVVHESVAAGFLLASMALPSVRALWSFGHFGEYSLAATFFSAVQIIIILAFGLKLGAANTAIIATILGGAAYFATARICVWRRGRKPASVEISKHELDPLSFFANSQAIVSERVLFDQFTVGLTTKTGLVFFYFIASRVLNGLFTLWQAFYVPIMSHKKSQKISFDGEVSLASSEKKNLSRGVAMITILAIFWCLPALVGNQYSVAQMVVTSLVGLSSSIVMAMFILGPTMSRKSPGRNVVILRLLWLCDFLGRIFFLAKRQQNFYLAWSLVLSFIEMAWLSVQSNLRAKTR